MKDIKEQVKAIIDEAMSSGAFNWRILNEIMEAIAETPELIDVKSSVVDIEGGIAVFQVFTEKTNREIERYKKLFTMSEAELKTIKFDRNIH